MEISYKTNGTKPKIRRLRVSDRQTPSSFTPAYLNVSCELKIAQWSERKPPKKVSTGFYL